MWRFPCFSKMGAINHLGGAVVSDMVDSDAATRIHKQVMRSALPDYISDGEVRDWIRLILMLEVGKGHLTEELVAEVADDDSLGDLAAAFIFLDERSKKK